MAVTPPTSDQTSDDTSLDGLMRALARLPTLPSAPRERGDFAGALHATHFEQFQRATDGRYELTELLGAGGMGVVYAGRNVRTERAVAIKFLRPRAEPTGVQRERALRFVREARAAGRIRHPNVVDLYDVESGVDTPYLVMELLQGESLRQRIERGRLPVREAVEILREALSGVIEAHENGVIHRDLKPDNIFLAVQRGSSRQVAKVLDFGVSRLLASDGSAASSAITTIGHLLGTPAYMPIEQLRGDLDCDARVDVYALGVTLYEAIGGTRPEGAHAPAGGSSRGARELVAELRERVPEVDLELARILERAIETARDDRYDDARSLAEDLDAWLSAHARAERANSARKRRLWFAAAPLVIALAGALIYGSGLWSLERSDLAATEPRAAKRALTDDARRRIDEGAHEGARGAIHERAATQSAAANAAIATEAEATAAEATETASRAGSVSSPSQRAGAARDEAEALQPFSAPVAGSVERPRAGALPDEARAASSKRASRSKRAREKASEGREMGALREPSLSTDPQRALELNAQQF